MPKPVFVNNRLTPSPRFYPAAIVMAVLLLLSGCGQQTSDTETPFSIADYQGRWLVLNYWAEWCAPCIKEIPELNALNDQHADQLAVVGVNFDRIRGQELTDLSKRMGISFDVLANDPADILRLSRPASLPTTYLFGPDGELKIKLVGPQTTESLLEKMGLN